MNSEDMIWHNHKTKNCGFCRIRCSADARVASRFFVGFSEPQPEKIRCPLLVERVTNGGKK